MRAVGGSGAFPSADAAAAAVAALDGLDAADVQLALDGGTVTMSGSVARATDRERLITALGRLHGVVEIRDRLRIRLE